jgi:two-component system, NarL family, sensor histidine kinase UhpB
MHYLFYIFDYSFEPIYAIYYIFNKMKSILKISLLFVFVITFCTKSFCQPVAKNSEKPYLYSNAAKTKADILSYEDSLNFLYISNANYKLKKDILKDILALDKQAEETFKKGFLKNAMLQNNILYKLATKINAYFYIVSAKNREALIFYEQGKNKEAEKMFLDLLLLNTKYPTKTAEIYSNLGSVYLALGDKEQASKYFFKALDLYESQNNLFGIGETYSNISSVYYLLSKADKAIEYQKKGIEAREKVNDKSGLVTANNNLGQLYLLKGNKDQSLIQLKQAVSYAEELNNPKLMGIAYSGMTTYYSLFAKYKEALIWQTKAMVLYERIDDKVQLSRLYVSAANLSNSMKDSIQAVNYFIKAIDISKAISNKENIGNAYEKMSIFYNSHNDSKKALKYYKTFIKYKDSINANSNLSKIEELQLQYNYEKKDNQIKYLQVEQKIKDLQLDKQNALINGNELLAKKKEAEIELLSKEAILLRQASELQSLKISQQDEQLDKQQLLAKNAQQTLLINQNEKWIKEKELLLQKRIKNFLLAGLFLILLSSVLFINRYQLKKKLEQQTALLEIRNNISKDLHDEIGSTLTSISILSNVSEQALEKQPAQAKEMIHQIAMQSKSIQQNMSDIVWSIRSENESIENLTTRIREYAAQTLEPLNIAFSISVDENILNQKLPIQFRKEILLICKEAINNIAKHSEANIASLVLQKNNKNIFLKIKDNGVWKGNNSGTGTKSMKERASAIKGNLIIETTNGTAIEVIIPIP